MNKRLFVAGLPFSTTQDELNTLFGQYGTVVSATIITDKMTGKSKGFGFVEMETDEEASNAITGLHDKEYGGRKLVVNIARPREERPREGGSRGGGFRSGGFGNKRFGRPGEKSFGQRREGGRGNFGRTKNSSRDGRNRSGGGY